MKTLKPIIYQESNDGGYLINYSNGGTVEVYFPDPMDDDEDISFMISLNPDPDTADELLRDAKDLLALASVREQFPENTMETDMEDESHDIMIYTTEKEVKEYLSHITF